MKKYKIITVILLSTLLSTNSQDLSNGNRLDNLIKNVLEKNPTLLAAREQFQVSLMDAGTGKTACRPTGES